MAGGGYHHIGKVVLVDIANGGILTHPDYERLKLNLDTMKPSIAYLDVAGGEVVEQVFLDDALHRLSIRHMALDAAGDVWFGCQWEGEPGERPPLVGRHRRGREPELFPGPAATLRGLDNYIGALAVDASGGLVVPVVRDVAASPLAEVARQTRWLVERARSGRLTAADMQGGVFTLTSLGSYGIEFFTPVINHPEAAILGVGAIRMQPVPPPGGQEGFILQRQLPLSLTFDHRVADGADGARFAADIVRRLEHPDQLLMDL